MSVHFLIYICAIATHFFQDGDAWSIGVTTTGTPTIGQLFRPCIFSLKASIAKLPLDIDDDAAQQVTSDVPHSYPAMSLDEAILKRYSCKKFRRFRRKSTAESTTSAPLEEDEVQVQHSASESDPSVIQRAIESLDLARRTPTAFNTQPYKVVVVASPEQKMALSKYCLGPNRQKVQDADCTVIFLADQQVVRTLPTFRKFIRNVGIMKKYRPLTNKALLQMQFYITLFSSSYPFPRFISSIVSFAIRTCMVWMYVVLHWFNYPLPTLSNAETWSSKQVTMVAMTYMLACTARGLATAPMEGNHWSNGISSCFFYCFHIAHKKYTLFEIGIDARGIRRVINAPSRYAIPLIVSTGIPFDQNTSITPSRIDDRYKIDELVFGDSFGSSLPMIKSAISS